MEVEEWCSQQTRMVRGCMLAMVMIRSRWVEELVCLLKMSLGQNMQGARMQKTRRGQDSSPDNVSVLGIRPVRGAVLSTV